MDYELATGLRGIEGGKVSNCDVCLIFDGDPAEVFTQENRKARKQYECCECARTIRIGETYQICKMMYEGQWDTYRTCLICAEIRKAFSCEGESIGGSFWDEMNDYGFP